MAHASVLLETTLICCFCSWISVERLSIMSRFDETFAMFDGKQTTCMKQEIKHVQPIIQILISFHNIYTKEGYLS